MAFRRRSGKDYTLSLSDIHFKVTRHIEIFIGRITTFLLFRIFQSTVPIRLEVEYIALRELHEERRIAGIHAGADAVVHLLVRPVRNGVLVCELPYAAESKERTELKGSL